ncbi:DNA (cytosine-5-)-methyltransferase [Aureimonas sp. ME7]|uniref:DNA cytosine methyltransferase n=1 Tax=Aureimonas sp. ME7 TaxID=2744252 RepID=UPI0015F5A5BC|nr:DNA (cytosine-5-)-methyltransferase [Aureimonas sp. ME7]
MTKPSTERVPSADRIKADRLRQIRGGLRSMGKRGLADVFAAGEALEEAAALCDGTFSAWVKSQCGIEPRTALGYRKTFLVLGSRKDWLTKRNVSPSVAVTVACAPEAGRERALAAIASGRALSVAEAKSIVRGGTQTSAPPSARASLRRSMRVLSAAFVEEVDRIARLAADLDPTDEALLAEVAVRARAIAPVVKALALRPVGGEPLQPDALARAVADLAAADARGIYETARRLARVAAAMSPSAEAPVPEATRASVPASPIPTPAPTMRSLSSAFRHGLTAVEICAGGGGQAAGLSKAGFRHVALVERNPHACATLRAAFGPDHVVEADLVGYDPGDLGPVDLLAGGVPCQPYSQSGERKGADDDRDLFPEALRLVERLRPRAVMLENVMGVFEPDNDMHRFRILARLEELGYTAEWGKVDASHFGVAQKRRRAVLVAFKEPKAMARFSWPTPIFNHEVTPRTATDALLTQFTAAGWTPTEEFMVGMDRATPTITGGSDKKQGIDFGQRKSALVWGQMGFVQTRIGDDPPAADHEGPVEATNAMLARLQAFPVDWPWHGEKKDIFRQIANAFPAPVAMHLGCAIASALTSETFDPIRQHVHEAMRRNHVAATGRSQEVATRRDAAIQLASAPKRIHLDLESLRAASDLPHAVSAGPNARRADSAPPTG